MKPNSPHRMWERVEFSPGCWLWTGTSRGPMGYGCMRVRGKMVRTHRLSYELLCGPIPPGKLVLHSCDTPRCVNPEHLFIGTHLDNARDMVSKGRCGTTKMTEDDVRSIRSRTAAGEKPKDLAKEFNVTPRAVAYVVHRKTWRHV